MIILLPLFIIGAAPFLIIPLTWWSIEFGLAAVLALLPTYLWRTNVWGIPTTSLELTIYGFAVGAALHWILRGGWRRVRLSRRTWVLLSVWIVAWFLSTAFSTDRQASLGAVKAWLVDPLIVAAIAMVAIRTREGLAVALRGLATGGTVVATAGFVQILFYHNTLQDGRLSSFFAPVANYAAMFLGPIIVITTGAVLWRLLTRWWYVAVCVMLIALALTVSFGGYIAVGFGLLALLATWPNKKTRNVAVVILAVVAIIGGGAVSQTRFFKEKLNTTDRSSTLVRTQIWRTSVEMIKDRPVFGVGPNAFESIYRQTIPKLYWPPLEWLVAQPHQLYLALWLETGLLGLITFVVSAIFWALDLRRRFMSGQPEVVIAGAAALAILIHGFVDTPIFKNDLAPLFMFIVALPYLLPTQKTN